LAVGLTAICSSGQSSLRVHVAPGQILQSPILAEFAFSYESALQTHQLQERRAMRVAPVYKPELERLQQFQRQIAQLAADVDMLAELCQRAEDMKARQACITTLLGSITQRYGLNLTEQDLEAVLQNSTVESRHYLWGEGLDVLRAVASDGIVDSALQTPFAGQRSYFMNFDLVEEESVRKNLRSQEDALLYLRIHLGALDEKKELVTALYHIFRHGIYPNLIYDREKTEERRALARSLVRPVRVAVEVGEIIVGAGFGVGKMEVERLQAYRQEMRKHSVKFSGISHVVLADFLLFFLICCCTGLVLQVVPQPYLQNFRKNFGCCAFFLIVNMLALKGCTMLWELHPRTCDPLIYRTLPYVTPWLVGVVIFSLLIGGTGGVSYALLLDVLLTRMLGKNFDFFLIILIAMLVAVQQCRTVIFKGQILRVSILSGFILGMAALWLAAFDNLEWHAGIVQLLGATAAGFANGVFAVILLAPLERLFQLTSNVRLQELSDFNHKLLRQLQLYAPGTYHHSLMVAHIAEQAAMDIQANGLLCRVAALFHDIGKITKPEYFIENQTDVNPHREKPPRISSLIIKSHVRDGMDVAGRAGIPPIVIRVMQEHHGTTLMQYFYAKAQQQWDQHHLAMDGINLTEQMAVEESFYRYDGPCPRSVEAAILMLVDSCEAASRSLHKITAQSVEGMVDSVFQNKIADGQLDECPITLRQVHSIRRSITASLLNSLHSRISYIPLPNE
jgi:putative nucleotidyltransferase with HDIG domain